MNDRSEAAPTVSGRPSLLSVVNWFPTPSETFVRRKLEGLAQAGFEVSVAAALFFDPGAEETGFGLVPTAPWRYPRSAWRALGAAGALRAARATAAAELLPGHAGTSVKRRALLAPFASAGADIIHFEFSGIAVGYRDLLRHLRPARIVVSCRGGNEQIAPFTEPNRTAELQEVFAEVDLIHCVSDAMRRTVVDLGAPIEKIFVNRPAIPVADFAPMAERRIARSGPLRLLSVGRLHWVKGYEHALRAVADLVAAGHKVEYRIVGDGDQLQKLSFMVRQLGIAGSVSLVGSQTQPMVRSHLEWADAFLLSSLSEGISNAVLEAMAAGLPVVSTECGGMAEVIVDEVNGFTVPVGDHHAMSERLVRLSIDRQMGLRLGAAAAVKARDDFDIARQVGVFVEAYGSLLG